METITQAPAPVAVMNEAWWNNFIDSTKGFTETVVVPDALPAAEVQFMNNLVLEVISELCRFKTNAYGLRVYLDGKQQDGAYLDSTIYPQAPTAGEDITQWSARVFEDKKFGIIINYAEKFSPALAQLLTNLLQPLLQSTGLPLDGMHTTTFIGNYGYTPLGIHQDHDGGNVIHFHLGPGSKIMYNWDAAEYEKLPGAKQNNTEVAPMLPHAQQYPFKTGDLYYMPWNKYHIGFSDELSVGVTVWFDNHSKSDVLNNILEAFKRQYMDMTDLTITSPETGPDGFTGFAHVESMLKLDERLEGLSFNDVLQEVYKEVMHTQASNGGWRAQPLSQEQANGYNENEYMHLQGKQVRLASPFRLYPVHVEKTDQLLVFSRASKIEIRYHTGFVNMIDQLNSGEVLAVDELLNHLPAEWPIEAGLYFLSLIYNKRGIDIV